MSTTTPTALDYAATPRRGGGLAKYHFLFRRLHSLTGILFGLYLFVHLGVNATLAEGARHDAGSDAARHPTVFQQQVDKIHSLPLLTFVEIAFIYLPIVYHTLYGFYILYTGQSNVGRYGYTRNWLYLFQRISGLIIVFFALFHVMTFKGWLPGEFAEALTFRPLDATRSTAQHLTHAGWIWGVVYPIGILASAFHTANGFYAAAITWGLTITAQAQKRWGIVCCALFFGLFAAGTTALVAGVLTARSDTLMSSPAAPDRIH